MAILLLTFSMGAGKGEGRKGIGTENNVYFLEKMSPNPTHLFYK